jgi:hypothetical protein
MMMSLQKFKTAFRESLLNLHWRQWQALGLMGRVPRGWGATIDLEALIVSTLAIGLEDRRLLLAAMEWMVANDRLVSVSRLKNIGRDFGRAAGGKQPQCFEPGLLGLVSELLRKSGQRGFVTRPTGDDSGRLPEYRQALAGFKVRNVVSLPQRLAGAAHLQLTARSLLGNDIRADVLAYLLLNRDANPFGLAREVNSDYKNVYLIIEGWRRAGIVERRGKADVLAGKAPWFVLLQTPPQTFYVNWAETLGALCQIEAGLGTAPWAGDEYLLSSLFRDLHPIVSPLAEAVDERLPAPGRYQGAEYFAPFAGALLAALQKVGETKKSSSRKG